MGAKMVLSHEQKAIRKLFAELQNVTPQTFPTSGFPDAPCARGVYIIYAPGGDVAHVGSTPRAKNGLRQRLHNHMQGQSSFAIKRFSGSKKKIGSQLRGRYKFKCLPVPGTRQRALLEAYAIGHLCPHHIGHGTRKGEVTLDS